MLPVLGSIPKPSNKPEKIPDAADVVPLAIPFPAAPAAVPTPLATEPTDDPTDSPNVFNDTPSWFEKVVERIKVPEVPSVVTANPGNSIVLLSIILVIARLSPSIEGTLLDPLICIRSLRLNCYNNTTSCSCFYRCYIVCLFVFSKRLS